jgi:hypothetical protein
MHQFSFKKYDLLVSGEIHIYQSNVMVMVMGGYN